MSERIVRVACGQGFWGDRPEAPLEQVTRGPVDYVVMDYLAEVTMSILQKARSRDPAQGYARDFIPVLRSILPVCVESGIRVLCNAGGVNLEACRDAALETARGLGLTGRVRVGTVHGDDILARLPSLIEAGHEMRNLDTGAPLADIVDRIQSANAYIGAAPLVALLQQGATVVVAGRSTDTALTYAPVAFEFGWSPEDVDRYAAGVVAGHLIECGAQVSGGNTMVDWESVPDMANVGHPIIEARADGSFVVTKHPGTGGRISRQTVTEQLLYEIGDPRSYITPDCVADFTTIDLSEAGPDAVRISGVRGRPRTDSLKVSIAYTDGWKSTGTLVYGWPNAVAKAGAADGILRERLDRAGLELDAIRTEFVGWNATHAALTDHAAENVPEVTLRVSVRGHDRDAVAAFGMQVQAMVLSGPPGVTGFGGGRPKVQEVVAYWPALIDRTQVEPFLRLEVADA
ncbi:MAG TPA: acyclic terpene utilization AtuA family protein [Gemmatimonadales bacterium]|nr:acyclic terpene utilization AtuA family protein [Gemmatimonadales bacterium]